MIFIVFLFLFQACLVKDLSDNGFRSTSQVKPFASSETLVEKFGDGQRLSLNFKIPLTQDTLGYYEVEEILGNENLDAGDKRLIKKVYDSFRYSFYNMWVKMGRRNHVMFRSYFDLPEVDSEYVKSAKIKRVIFTTDKCHSDLKDCNGNKRSGFSLIDSLFVNIASAHKTLNGASFMINELDYDEFEDISRKAFVKTAVDYEKELFSKDNYRHINLLKMKNPPPLIDVSRLEHVTDNKLYRLKVSDDKAAITQYLKGDKFKPYIRHVHSQPILNSDSYELYRKRPNGILIELRKRGHINELKNVIEGSTSSVQKNMLVVKVEKNALELKKIYEEAYSQYLNDISLVGNILFIELQEGEYVSFFKEKLEKTKQQFADFGEVQVNQCDYFSCLDLKGTGLNLIPFLEKSPQIFIDTYLGLNKLVRNDFTFHGFIEIEVELSLPL
jgi:hypothetical protein